MPWTELVGSSRADPAGGRCVTQNPIMTADSARLALAVAIGGTKFAAAVVTGDGEVVLTRRTDTPRSMGSDVVFHALTSVVDETLAAAGLGVTDPDLVPAIGVGTAAPLDLGVGTVSPVNIPGWRSFPLRDRLSERYGLPVGMIGDAVAVAVAEH